MYKEPPIDLRLVFKCYAGVVGTAGLLIQSWGPTWFGSHLSEQAWGKAALIRVAGSVLVAAAFAALGFAATTDPLTLRRGMFWFTMGHLVVCMVIQSQRMAIWGSGLADKVGFLSVTAAFFLFYLWGLSRGAPGGSVILGLFSKSAAPPDDWLRSRYEEQIRASGRLEERNRLARDLHDSIKQQIFVIQTAAATAQARFDGDNAGARQALDQVRDSAREAMTEMEAMLHQMSAAPLENAGLVEALRKHCEAVGFRTGAKVEFQLGDLPEAGSFAPGAHEAILRTAQEALSNAARHARPKQITVSLGTAGHEVRLRVEDDGAGFDTAHAPRGQGIANIRARAEEFGGSFELDSRPGKGTTVTISIPFERPEPAIVYRDRAIEMGVSLAVAVVLLQWSRSPLVLAIAAVAAVFTARYAFQYFRLRRQGAQ
jgi:signal transduction histidine kinase